MTSKIACGSMVDRGRDVSRDVLFAQTCFVLFFSPSERIEFFVVCFLYTSGQMFLSQTSSRRPPHIIGRRVTSVTLGWVGAPIERALLRFRDAIAVFADRCLTRIRMADQGLGGGFMNIARASSAPLNSARAVLGRLKIALQNVF